MSSNTPNLDLLKVNPVTDGNSTFNVDTMLNDNWDKIDTVVGDKIDKVDGKGLSTLDFTQVLYEALVNSSSFGVTSTTGPNPTDFSVSLNPVPSMVAGTRVTIQANANSHPTNQATLMIQGFQNKINMVRKDGSFLRLLTNNVYSFLFDGTVLRLQGDWNPAGATTAADGLMTAADKQALINMSSSGTTAGTATAYTLSAPGVTLTISTKITIKAHIDSGASPTLNLNALGAKPIVKNGGAAAALKKDYIYTIGYDPTGTGSFILQGEGGEYGTATAAQVLSGYSIGTEAGLVNGSITNNGAGGTVTPSGSTQSKPAGYYSTPITIAAVAVPAAALLVGNTVAGTAGTMPNNGAVNRTPSNVAQSIPAGYTSGGTVSAVTFDASKLLTGTTVASTAGAMQQSNPDYSDQLTATGSSYGAYSGNGLPYIYLGMTPNRYYSGVNWLRLYEAGLIPSNVRSGVTAFGGQLVGTMVEGKRWAQGVYPAPNSQTAITISGLAFTPSIILWWQTRMGSSHYYGAYHHGKAFYSRFDSDGVSGGNGEQLSIITGGFTKPWVWDLYTDFNWMAFE